jgi:hypothetical protein
MNFQPPPIPDIKLPESFQEATQSLGNSINSIKSDVNSTLDDFSNQATAGVGASTSFLDSNTIVAKFAFVILVIIGFLFLMNLGVIILGYFFSPSNNPFIIKGLITGQTENTFTQDPNVADKSKLIKLSNNERSGMEFTWSVWLFINDLPNQNENLTKHQFVFNKGDLDFDPTTNITKVNNGPGLYIMPNTNGIAKLKVIMNSAVNTDVNNTIIIDSIPIRKWVNVIIRLENTMLDVYVNGTISGRLNLPLVAKQNYNDVNVCKSGGFNGNLSDLRYFNHALSIIEINNIVYWGPNTSASKNGVNAAKSGNYNYLSSLWYSSKL